VTHASSPHEATIDLISIERKLCHVVFFRTNAGSKAVQRKSNWKVPPSSDHVLESCLLMVVKKRSTRFDAARLSCATCGSTPIQLPCL
jgi:hypothetical protein